MCWVYTKLRRDKEEVIGRVVTDTFRTQNMKARLNFRNSNLPIFWRSLNAHYVSGTLPAL